MVVSRNFRYLFVFYNAFHCVVTSRSLHGDGGGFLSLLLTKKEVKIERLEHAIDDLKYESEPSCDESKNSLLEFLDHMNEFG